MTTPSNKMAIAATILSRFPVGRHEPKIGCRKYLANVNETAAFLGFWKDEGGVGGEDSDTSSIKSITQYSCPFKMLREPLIITWYLSRNF